MISLICSFNGRTIPDTWAGVFSSHQPDSHQIQMIQKWLMIYFVSQKSPANYVLHIVTWFTWAVPDFCYWQARCCQRPQCPFLGVPGRGECAVLDDKRRPSSEQMAPPAQEQRRHIGMCWTDEGLETYMGIKAEYQNITSHFERLNIPTKSQWLTLPLAGSGGVIFLKPF